MKRFEIIFCSISDRKIREQLLEQQNLSFQKVNYIAILHERTAQEHVKTENKYTDRINYWVYFVKKWSKNISCFRYSNSYLANSNLWRAKNLKCRIYNKIGHIENACINRNLSKRNNLDNNFSDNEVNSIHQVISLKTEPYFFGFNK